MVPEEKLAPIFRGLSFFDKTSRVSQKTRHGGLERTKSRGWMPSGCKVGKLNTI